MVTISQDIFNICITCIVYEVRRKGIIYSKTCFFSLFTPCLGIKSQSNKSRKKLLIFFLPKCPIVFKSARLLCFCYVYYSVCYFELDLVLWVGTQRPSRSDTFDQFQQQRQKQLIHCSVTTHWHFELLVLQLCMHFCRNC